MYETYSSDPNKTRHVEFGKSSAQELGKPAEVQVFHKAEDGKGNPLRPDDEAEELKRLNSFEDDEFMPDFIRPRKLRKRNSKKNQQ